MPSSQHEPCRPTVGANRSFLGVHSSRPAARSPQWGAPAPARRPAWGTRVAAPPGFLIVALPMILALFMLLASASAKKPAPPPAAPVLPPPPAMETGANPIVGALSTGALASADWYFVLDTAGGMLPIAQAARADIAKLVEVIPEGDRVAIVAMHTRPTDALPLTAIDGVNRQTLVDKVKTVDLTSAKDVDLGGGLSWTVHHLGEAGAAPLSFVVMLGPFCHSPSIASDFDSGGRGCRPIRGLDKIAQTWESSRGDKLVQATLVQVAPADGVVDPVGVDAARKVFPGAVSVVGQQFSTWAADFRARLPLQRLLPLVHRDAERAGLALTITSPPTEARPIAGVQASGRTQALPLHLSNVRVNGVPYPDADLSPSVTWEVPLELPDPGLRLWPTTERVELPITVTADAELRPADGLRALSIDPARPGVSTTTAASIERRLGPSYGQLVALGVLGALFAGLVVAYGRVRGRKTLLEGSFSYRPVGQARRVLDLSALQEAPICIGLDGELVVGRRADAVFILRMVKTSLGADAELEVLKADVQINSKPSPPGVYPVRVGATSVQFGDYRLTWE